MVVVVHQPLPEVHVLRRAPRVGGGDGMMSEVTLHAADLIPPAQVSEKRDAGRSETCITNRTAVVYAPPPRLCLSEQDLLRGHGHATRLCVPPREEAMPSPRAAAVQPGYTPASQGTRQSQGGPVRGSVPRRARPSSASAASEALDIV